MAKIKNEHEFNQCKNDLLLIIKNRLEISNLDDMERISLKQLADILNEYTFFNRLEMKGTLGHTITDSLTLDYSIGEKFIQFDNNLIS